LGESLSLREELQSNDEAVAVMEQVVNEYPDAVYHCPHPEHPLHRLVEEAKESVFVLKHLSVGRQAPEIVGNGRDGTEFKLSDFRGKIVVLDFWADWCPPCRQMVPHEKQLALDLKDKPFALIGVYCDESRALEKFIAKESINWVNWIDGKTGPISEHWRIQAFPTLFVLDRSGVIRHRHVGVVDPETLRGWVENLLAD
jgi:thiol-disulfide isomerase/thioredoxin